MYNNNREECIRLPCACLGRSFSCWPSTYRIVGVGVLGRERSRWFLFLVYLSICSS